MKIEKIKNRSILFKYPVAEWDLNIHLIMGKKYNYIIDSGLGSDSIAPILEYLKNSHAPNSTTNANPNPNPNPIILINTHYHWDHVWGNHAFKDCTIISHRLCRETISAKWDEMLEKKSQFVKGEAKLCLPNLVFEDSLYFPDDKIRIFYTPGHTFDSISVLDEEESVMNVADNIGDTVDEIVPSIETEKKVYINTLLRYKGLNVDACVSGHNVILGQEVFDTILKELGESVS